MAGDLWEVTPIWWWRGAKSCLKMPLSIGSRSWPGSGERISSSSIQSPSWFNSVLLVAVLWCLTITALLCRELPPILSILQVQTLGKGIKWAAQVYAGSFPTGSERDFSKWHCNAWLRKYSSSSQSFSFSSCVPKPRGEWGMSTRVLLTHHTASPGRSSSASAAVPGAGELPGSWWAHCH